MVPRVDCVVYNYNARLTDILTTVLDGVCNVTENIGGSYLDHYRAVAQSEKLKHYAYVMVWGPRLWIPAESYDVRLLVDILQTNNLKAIEPSIRLKECPSEYSPMAMSSITALPDASPDALSGSVPDTLPMLYPRRHATKDLKFMTPRPLVSNTSAGRRVDMVEWQVGLFPIHSFTCLTTYIERLNLKYWGSDMIFPLECKARVGIVDLPDLSLSKCRSVGSTPGSDYANAQGWKDNNNALEDAMAIRRWFKIPTGKTLGILRMPS